MTKEIICKILSDIAFLLEIKGECSFKIRAYQNAVHSLEACREDLSEIIDNNNLLGAEKATTNIYK